MKCSSIFALALTAMFAIPVTGQVADPGGVIAADAVEAFFDNAWEQKLSVSGKVPGAVVTVVSRDGVLLNKGYGTRDIDTGEPADPDVTRLRIGSTSKLFTAMTTLALVDEEKLVLDSNINGYPTEIKIADTFAEPVTVRALLSHLSGFTAQLSGFMVDDNNAVGIEPEHYQRMLQRLRPVGREYGYDNTGLGLLGYLAAEVSDSTFAAEVRRTVLDPLRMPNTEMGVPDRQLPHLAACHSWDEAGNVVKCQHKFMREVTQGAGDISTTGADMARFMRALLNGGCLDGRCVLQPATFSQFVDMDQNRFHPEALGLGFIMMEQNFGPRYAIGHGGGQDGYSTSMSVFPDAGVGVFISQFSYMGIPADDRLSVYMDMGSRGGLVNTYGAANETIKEFAEAFLPESPGLRQPVSTDFEPDDLSPLAGIYADTRQIGAQLHTRMFRTLATLPVEVDGDKVYIGESGPFRQVGKRVLAADDEELRWFYDIQESGHVVMQNSMGMPVAMFAKQPWHYQASYVVLPLLLPIVLILPAIIFLVWGAPQGTVRSMTGMSLFIGIAVLLGLYLEVEYFSANYFPEGATVWLMAWRLLLNLGWGVAVFLLYKLITQRSQVLQFAGGLQISQSVFVVLSGLSALAVAILIPYWGLLGNFTH